jgi:hypothetical protein
VTKRWLNNNERNTLPPLQRFSQLQENWKLYREYWIIFTTMEDIQSGAKVTWRGLYVVHNWQSCGFWATLYTAVTLSLVESSWNVMAHGDAREGKWRGNWRMEWVASTLHTTSEHGVSSVTTADAHTLAASSLLNWRPRRFKWTRPFRRETKSGFCACAITFQTQSTTYLSVAE